MKNGMIKWIRATSTRLVGSIAFYPAIISLGFLLLSVLMLEIDFSETGKNIKSQLSWLSLRDASTARSILGTIAGGIISLAVFSFSMVMILLNQAASQMSNRMLDSMIGNKFQQIVLGFYIGTIVYSLFLLSTIRDISSGIYVPALSIYLLLLFTVFDIFLFIYFLHYITQSVKYDTIISRIHHQTLNTLKKTCRAGNQVTEMPPGEQQYWVKMPSSNYYQGFNKNLLLSFLNDHNLVAHFLFPAGSYILQDVPFMCLYGDKAPDEDALEQLMLTIDIYRGQPIDKNAYYGYHQLAEVAIKALSPGINDPQTAVLSIHALTDIFRYKLCNYLPLTIANDKGEKKIYMTDWTFEAMFTECYHAIWDYGKNDRYVQNALRQMLDQLDSCCGKHDYQAMLNGLRRSVDQR